ncbi:MAG: helix-turn-helix domain-containing protein [Thermodesulfobacteriota bacterium]
MPQKSAELSFIGKNIRQLRRRRGWTIGRLAGEIGMAEVPLGRIERGENAPSAAVLLQLSKVLSTSIDALFAEEPDAPPTRHANAAGAPFVPVRAADRLPPSLLATTQELISVVCSLEDICGAQKQAKIPLNIAFEANLRGLQDLSEAARNHMGIGRGIVFDYIELFEAMGFRVIFMPLPKETASITFFDTENQNAFFFIRYRENPERQIFHLVYGLGRIFFLSWMQRMGRKPFPSDDEPGAGPGNTEEASAPKPQGEEEKLLTMHRAGRKFAAFFLMPEQAIRATVNQLGIENKQWSWDLLLRIKHRFGVSAESFLFRLRELDLITDKLHDRFRKQIQAHYEATGYAEPDASRRILTPNGRVWDLVLTARQHPEARAEVARIEETLNRWKVAMH